MKELIKEIQKTLRLLDSMVQSGEKHSEQSKEMYRDAQNKLDKLLTQQSQQVKEPEFQLKKGKDSKWAMCVLGYNFRYSTFAILSKSDMRNIFDKLKSTQQEIDWDGMEKIVGGDLLSLAQFKGLIKSQIKGECK